MVCEARVCPSGQLHAMETEAKGRMKRRNRPGNKARPDGEQGQTTGEERFTKELVAFTVENNNQENGEISNTTVVQIDPQA